MARFSADGQDYTRAVALGTVTDYTVCTWVKVTTDRNTWSTAWSLDNGTGDVEVIQTTNDGTTFGLYSDGNNPTLFNATVGTWYFVAVSRSGTGGTAYHGPAGAALATVSLAGSSASTNMATLRLGESPWGGEWLNGCINAWKLWTGVALTQAEVERERAQYLPARLANLQAFYPLVRPETTDYSGNARTLTGSGATREDGPPIPWAGVSPRYIRAATSGGPVTGTAAAPLGSLTATASGTPTVSATAAAAFGALTASAAGVTSVAGTATAQLGALTATAAGVQIEPGTASAPLGGLAASASGAVTADGTAAAPLGALTAAATGAVTVSANAAAALGGLTATAAGLTQAAGTASAPFGALTATAAGTVTGAGGGSAAATLGSLAASAAGTVTVTASAAALLGALAAQASGQGSTAAATAPLGALAATAVGLRTVSAAAAAVLGGLAASAAGVTFVAGTAAALLGALAAGAVVTPPVTFGAMTATTRDTVRMDPTARTTTAMHSTARTTVTMGG